MHTALALRRTLAISVALLTALVASTFAPNARADAPPDVHVGVYLHDVTKFDQKDGVFDVDIEMWVKWLGDFDPERVTITNGATLERTLIGSESDGTWHSSRWRVRGTLRGEFPLQRFPFDAQTIGISFELDDRFGHLEPDLAGSGMRDRFSITGWNYDPSFRPRVSSTVYRSDLGSLDNEGHPTQAHRVSFEVTLRRPMLTVATKFFLPLIVILLVALIALFLPADKIDARAGIGVTALLSCFAFQFAVADTMPNVTYVTVADGLFIIAYALIAGLLGVSITAFYLDSNGKRATSRRLDQIARWAVPLAVLVPTFFLARPPPAVAQPEPPRTPRTPRHASSRDRVRIGVTSLTSALGGLLSSATTWSCVHRGANGRRAPTLVEQAPSISNDALHFLAGGEFEVVWRLRPGLRWSDGHPITSRDIVFVETVSPNPHTRSARVIDDRTAVIRYDDRIASVLDDFTPLPEHALSASFRQGGYEAVREYRRTHPTPASGPYRLVEFVANDHARLEANGAFYDTPPAIRTIEIRRFADGASIVRAFEAGEIDITGTNAVLPEQADVLARTHPGTVHVQAADQLVFLHPDLTVPLLARTEVRRAIVMAIDRDRLRNDVFGPDSRIANIPAPGPLPSGTSGIPFDPNAARQIVQEAGAEGTHITLTTGTSETDRAISRRVVTDLAAVGLIVDLHEVPNVGDLYRSRRHGGLLLQTTTANREDSPRRFWNLPMVRNMPDANARNAAYDDSVALLAEREERAMYDERRDQLRNRLLAAFVEKLPLLPLAFSAERIVADTGLRGWQHDEGVAFGRGIENWYFE
jgi:peptide/nickel transport system substrate-binding protein